MENERLSLSQIKDRLDFTQESMKNYFHTANSSDAVSFGRDERWGRRTMNIMFRLDDFSIYKLKDIIPKIETLLLEYKRLRKMEATELNQVAIDKKIRQQIDPTQGLY